MDRTRASAVEGRRLTAWAMARPASYVTSSIVCKCKFDLQIMLIADKGQGSPGDLKSINQSVFSEF
jgi:hypothetical protein